MQQRDMAVADERCAELRDAMQLRFGRQLRAFVHCAVADQPEISLP
jgi:hypothetical protein